MTERDEPEELRRSELLGGLPNARPQRRSGRRPAPSVEGPENPATTGPAAPAPAAGKAPTVKALAGQAPTSKAPGGKAAAAPGRKAPAPPPRAHARRARPKPDPLPQPAQPSGAPPSSARREHHLPIGGGVLGSAVQAAAELTEFGLSTSARALRGALSRLPKR